VRFARTGQIVVADAGWRVRPTVIEDLKPWAAAGRWTEFVGRARATRGPGFGGGRAVPWAWGPQKTVLAKTIVLFEKRSESGFYVAQKRSLGMGGPARRFVSARSLTRPCVRDILRVATPRSGAQGLPRRQGTASEDSRGARSRARQQARCTAARTPPPPPHPGGRSGSASADRGPGASSDDFLPPGRRG